MIMVVDVNDMLVQFSNSHLHHGSFFFPCRYILFFFFFLNVFMDRSCRIRNGSTNAFNFLNNGAA